MSDAPHLVLFTAVDPVGQVAVDHPEAERVTIQRKVCNVSSRHHRLGLLARHEFALLYQRDSIHDVHISAANHFG